MLVITRLKHGRVIVLDPKTREPLISFSILDIRGDRVRVGIDAPRDYPVHREEVVCRIAQQQRLSA